MSEDSDDPDYGFQFIDSSFADDADPESFGALGLDPPQDFGTLTPDQVQAQATSNSGVNDGSDNSLDLEILEIRSSFVSNQAGSSLSEASTALNASAPLGALPTFTSPAVPAPPSASVPTQQPAAVPQARSKRYPGESQFRLSNSQSPSSSNSRSGSPSTFHHYVHDETSATTTTTAADAVDPPSNGKNNTAGFGPDIKAKTMVTSDPERAHDGDCPPRAASSSTPEIIILDDSNRPPKLFTFMDSRPAAVAAVDSRPQKPRPQPPRGRPMLKIAPKPILPKPDDGEDGKHSKSTSQSSFFQGRSQALISPSLGQKSSAQGQQSSLALYSSGIAARDGDPDNAIDASSGVVAGSIVSASPSSSASSSVSAEDLMPGDVRELFYSKPKTEQIKIRACALFSSYADRIEILVQRFMDLILKVEKSDWGIPKPDEIETAMEVAGRLAPDGFWPACIRQELRLIMRLRNWMTELCRNKKYDCMFHALSFLQNIPLTHTQLQAVKLTGVLNTLVKRGDAQTAQMASAILVAASRAEPKHEARTEPEPKSKANGSFFQNLALYEDKAKVKGKEKGLPKEKAAHRRLEKDQTKDEDKSQVSASDKNQDKAGENDKSKSVEKVRQVSFSDHMASLRKRKESPSASAAPIDQGSASGEPKRKKAKTVRWNEEQLVSTRLFEVDESEYRTLKKVKEAARTMDAHEAQALRKTEPAADHWRVPPELDLSGLDSLWAPVDRRSSAIKRGGKAEPVSSEAKRQKEREMRAIVSYYFKEEDIPPNPAEPDAWQVKARTRPVKAIPLHPDLESHPNVIRMRTPASVPLTHASLAHLVQSLSSLVQNDPESKLAHLVQAIVPDQGQAQNQAQDQGSALTLTQAQAQALAQAQAQAQGMIAQQHSQPAQGQDPAAGPELLPGQGLNLRQYDVREWVRSDSKSRNNYRTPCKFYPNCWTGDNCPYLHINN